MNEQTNDNSFDALGAEQKNYVQILAHKKRLYAAHKTLNEAVQTTLGMDDHEQAFKLAQQVSKAAKQVQDTASYLTHQQKQIEQHHPEFKEQAKNYAQNRDTEHQKQDRGQKQDIKCPNTQQQIQKGAIKQPCKGIYSFTGLVIYATQNISTGQMRPVSRKHQPHHL